MKQHLLLTLSTGLLLASCSKQEIVDPASTDRELSGSSHTAYNLKRSKTVQKTDYNQIYTIPCANNSEGEQVSLVGTAELSTETMQLGPVTTVITIFKIINATGKGAATEKVYNGKGGYVSVQLSSTKDSRFSYDYDEKVAVTAKGSNKGIIYKMTASQSIGPKGNVIKAYQVKETTECN